uniref:HTH OST-type domain-containing protein n=1 Tax=Strongyloides venezuelensis TaxID=75913 RepID=A0A0K0FZD4_STRVS
MSLRSSSTPVKANNRLGNDTNDKVPRVPFFNAFTQAEIGLSKDAQQSFTSLTRDKTYLYDGVNPIMSSMTSPLASALPYGDSLEGTNVFAFSNKESKIKTSFNNLINKITNPVSSKHSMVNTTPLNRSKRQIDVDDVIKLLLEELKSEQINALKYSPSSEAIIDLPDVRAQVSDNLGLTRSYNALFDMVLRAKLHGAFYQFKGKSLTSFTLFISDCMTAIRQLAITDDEIPMLDRIAGRHIDYLIPRDSKIAHARHIAVEKKSDITKGHKQYDFTLSEILKDIKMVLESQGMNRLEQFNACPPMENAMDVSTFAKKFNDYLRRRFTTNQPSEFLKDKPDLRREQFYLFTRGLHPILRENNSTKNLYELQYDEFIATYVDTQLRFQTKLNNASQKTNNNHNNSYKNNNKHINKNSNVSKNKQSNLKFDNTKKAFSSSGTNNSKEHQSRYSSVKPANKPTTSYNNTSSGMNYKSQNNQSSGYNKNSIKTKPQKHGKIHTIEPTHEECHDGGEMNV